MESISAFPLISDRVDIKEGVEIFMTELYPAQDLPGPKTRQSPNIDPLWRDGPDKMGVGRQLGMFYDHFYELCKLSQNGCHVY